MMNNHRIGRLRNLVLCCCLALCTGCSQNDLCLEPQAVNMRVGFYRLETSSALKDTQLTQAVIRFGSASSYFLSIDQSSKFALPLAQNNDTTELLFQPDTSAVPPSPIDTLHLVYTRKPTFISTACGYRTYFTLQQVFTTHHVIDSVILNQREISNDVSKEHLQFVIQ